MMQNDDRKTIIYCRESRDDFGENYERIETQRDILLGFCKNRGLANIIDIVMDDNISGTRFSRFNGIVDKAKKGQVDVIVFKDASRLGRNLRESLNFIHILEECDVEVLFESETYDEAFFPLLAWFNEQRAREDSKKVRRVFKHKMESGELLIRGLYGYNKQDRELIIKEQEAAVIRRVYNLFLDGCGANQIATMLNCENVPTPSQSQYRCDNRAEAAAWNRQHIYRILTNSMYTGEMVYSKREKKSFKSTKMIAKSPDEWIVIPEHHEQIISKEVFDKVQNLRNRIKRRGTKAREPKLFSGLLVCGRCGYQLVQRIRAGRKDAYICAKNHREGCIKDDVRPNYGCNTHHVSEEELKRLTVDFCKAIIDGDSDFTHRILNLQQKKQDSQNGAERAALLKKEIAKYESVIEKIYDDKLSGASNIPANIIDKKLNEYNQKINDAKNALDLLKDTRDDKQNLDVQALKESMETLLDEGLNNRMLRRCFDKIIYYLPEEITEEAKLLNNLSDEVFCSLKEHGGFLFKVNQF